jgi:hypothetical protein
VTAVATAVFAGFAGFELWMMRAETPAAFGTAVRWGHAPIWVVFVSLVGFVRLYLRAGRLWLACGLRTLSLILNFVFTPNLNYREITAFRHVSFLGETVVVAEGVPNPWMLIGQLTLHERQGPQRHSAPWRLDGCHRAEASAGRAAVPTRASVETPSELSAVWLFVRTGVAFSASRSWKNIKPL